MSELAKVLTKEFKDKEYAHAYIQSHLIDKIAAQVHALRQQRGKRQEDIEKSSGIPQARLSKIESADFDSLTLKTLFKLAKAFDVAVDVRFQSFSDAIADVVGLTKEGLQVPARTHDLGATADMHRFVINPMLKAFSERQVARQPPIRVMAGKGKIMREVDSDETSPT